MKHKHIIWSVLAVLCLLGTGSYAWILYEEHRKRVAEWDEEAKASFEEALWMEVDKRSDISFYNFSSENDGLTTLNVKIPDSVHVTSAFGRRAYRLDRFKYDNSLIQERKKRTMVSSLLSKYPLLIDALVMHWDSLLSDKNIPVNSRIRYINTDLDLRNDTIYSDEGYSFSRKDSLTVKYLGFRCEHELVAYTSYDSWIFNLFFLDWFCLLLPWLIFVLVVVFYVPMERFFQRKFVKEKVVERKVHVTDVEIAQAKTFLLSDGSLFDSFSNTLKKGELSKQLSPQLAILLELFLRKENHRLSPVEIQKELWKGQGTAVQLHKAIQRLRAELKKVSSDLVIKNINGDYELKSTISSKIFNMNKTDKS